MKLNEKGFSLIGIIVVIAIIGILTSIAIPNYTAYKKAAIFVTQEVDVTNLRLSVEMFYSENGEYPTGLSELKGYGFSNLSSNNESWFSTANGYCKCIKVIITNPRTNKNAIYESGVGHIQKQRTQTPNFLKNMTRQRPGSPWKM